jgi:hypothetical protein
MRACSGTWIAHGSGSADREVVDVMTVSRAAGKARPTDPPRLAECRGRRPATTTASPTRGSGRCAISPMCGRPSAPPTGRTMSRSIASSPRPWFDEAKTPPPDRAGAGLPLRAAAAHDPRETAEGDGDHLLAHSLAQSRILLDLPLARARSSPACSAAASSASTPSSTATTSSTPWIACSRRASTAKVSLSPHRQLTAVRRYPISIAWPPAGGNAGNSIGTVPVP